MHSACKAAVDFEPSVNQMGSLKIMVTWPLKLWHSIMAY